jgi:excisionase family DNA binding protein
MLGVTPRTLRNWIAEGRLTAYRIGDKLIRIDRAELDALIRPIPTAGNAA